jgi:REP element-mobilizing transposase RayT
VTSPGKARTHRVGGFAAWIFNNGLENPFSVGYSLRMSSEFFKPSAGADIHIRSLPHWEQAGVWCFVTWRLADSLPQAKLHELEHEKQRWLTFHSKPWSDEVELEYHDRFTHRVDEWLDRGAGSCLLRTPENAAIVNGALQHFEGARYQLFSYVIMPNHVHVLFQPSEGRGIAEILKSWKGFTARAINEREGKNGALWQAEFWDRLVRNEEHFAKCAEYIRMNPIRAKLRAGEFSFWERRTGFPTRCPKPNGESR